MVHLALRMYGNWPTNHAIDHNSIGLNRLTIQLMFNEVSLFTFSQGTHGFDVTVPKNWLKMKFYCSKSERFHRLSLVDPRGGTRDACPPLLSVQISSISCSFWGKLPKIIGWRPHLCRWCTPLWEILDPPLVIFSDWVFTICNLHWRI